jgi:hypothetical protein
MIPSPWRILLRLVFSQIPMHYRMSSLLFANRDLVAGFEAVLLALYAAETKARGGRPVMINIPDLGQASLYHSPRHTTRSAQSVSHSSVPLCAYRLHCCFTYNVIIQLILVES